MSNISPKKLLIDQMMESYNNKDYEKSVQLLTESIAVFEMKVKLYLLRSECYQHLNRLTEALDDANHCIQLDDQYFGGHYQLGRIYLAKKQFRSAEKAFTRSLICNPNNDKSKRFLKQTLNQFVQNFGFTHNESQQLTDIYKTCTEFTDALIDGKLLEVFNNSNDSKTPVESSVSSFSSDIYESDETECNPRLQTSHKSITVSNLNQMSDDFIPFENKGLQMDSRSKSVNCNTGFRQPKSLGIKDIKKIKVNNSLKTKYHVVLAESIAEFEEPVSRPMSECSSISSKNWIKTRNIIKKSVIIDDEYD